MTKRTCPVCDELLPPSRTRPRICCSHAYRQAAVGLERRAKSLAQRAAKAEAAWERVREAKRG
jgi:hypothetical protein